jgi:HPt (histidine-containing phosphotransfer) domain-containing protein
MTDPDEPIEQILDPAAALNRALGNVTFLRELIDVFAEEEPRMMAAIGAAIGQGDAKGLRYSAHALKGTVANFFAPGAIAAAARLEAMGRAGDLAGVAEGYAALEEEMRRLRRALRKLVSPPESSTGESAP